MGKDLWRIQYSGSSQLSPEMGECSVFMAKLLLFCINSHLNSRNLHNSIVRSSVIYIILSVFEIKYEFFNMTIYSKISVRGNRLSIGNVRGGGVDWGGGAFGSITSQSGMETQTKLS